MCVRDDNLLNLKTVLLDQRQDVVDLVARIDDDRFAGRFVTDDRAIALQWAYRQDLVNHGAILSTGSHPCARGFGLGQGSEPHKKSFPMGGLFCDGSPNLFRGCWLLRWCSGS